MAEPKPAPETFLSRWSRRKLAAARTVDTPPAMPSGADGDVPAVDAGKAVGAHVETLPAGTAPEPQAETPPLPPVDSLTFDSDFTGFLQQGVDPATRQAALRKLLRDPHFNVMDGLDVYIDDYSKPSPIAPEVVRQLAHARYLFSPPRTRVNAAGHVEDVPDHEGAAPPEAAHGDAASGGGDAAVACLDGTPSAAERTSAPNDAAARTGARADAGESTDGTGDASVETLAATQEVIPSPDLRAMPDLQTTAAPGGKGSSA